MIRSVARPQSLSWHRAHLERHRRSWLIMTILMLVAVTVGMEGYFGPIPWFTLMEAVIHTTYRLAVAYLIALLAGVTIALLVGWSSLTDPLFPIFDILQNIPSFALIPFFIYFFGYTDTMIILFAVSSIIWPILFSVLSAIKNTHQDLNDAASIFGARGWRRIPYYLSPLSFPAVLTGSIVGIAIGWEAVIGSEIITSISGFGDFIKNASSTGITPVAIAGMLVILILVFVINRLVWAPLLAESGRRFAE